MRNPTPPSAGTGAGARLELTIEKLVYGGDGLARVTSPDGRRQVVFVPFTLPGEVVVAEVNRPAGGRTTARLIEILRPSPERIAPQCEYFGRCGGCQSQHTGAPYQLQLKREILIETLQRTGGVAWSGEVALHAAAPWEYRNRIRLQRTPEGVGYHYRESHQVLPVTHCPIASPLLNRALDAMVTPPAGDRSEVELATNNADEGLLGEAPLIFQAGEHRYRVSPGSFFQVNRFLATELVEVVTGGVEGECAVDLFSGVGLFALPLARRFARVQAVENHPPAVADLAWNASGSDSLRVSNLSALAYLSRRPANGLDLLVADPPRAGLGQELVAAILAQEPAWIHLVSCDPSTLGRDLRALLAGGHEIVEVHLFDLFPQTYHLETVVKLRRLAPDGRLGRSPGQR